MDFLKDSMQKKLTYPALNYSDIVLECIVTGMLMYSKKKYSNVFLVYLNSSVFEDQNVNSIREKNGSIHTGLTREATHEKRGEYKRLHPSRQDCNFSWTWSAYNFTAMWFTGHLNRTVNFISSTCWAPKLNDQYSIFSASFCFNFSSQFCIPVVHWSLWIALDLESHKVTIKRGPWNSSLFQIIIPRKVWSYCPQEKKVSSC